MTTAVLCTPLRVEQAALRRAGGSTPVIRTGMGPRRAAATAARLPPTAAVLVAGLAGAQTRHIHSGDLVVATEVRTSALVSPSSTPELFARRRTALWSNSATGGLAGSVEIPSAPLLAGALRGVGLRVHLGAVRSVPGIAWKPVDDVALAVDMESAALAPAGAPFAVVRAIVDTPDHPLWHVGTLHRGVAALRSLKACRPALEWWAAATGPREILLAGPRSLRAIAREVDLVLVAGSANSSNSVRLVEVAQREGVPAHLVDDPSEIDLRWLAGRARLGITAGTSAPPHLVAEIVHCLGGLGCLTVRESRMTDEDVAFALPKEVI